MIDFEIKSKTQPIGTRKGQTAEMDAYADSLRNRNRAATAFADYLLEVIREGNFRPIPEG